MRIKSRRHLAYQRRPGERAKVTSVGSRVVIVERGLSAIGALWFWVPLLLGVAGMAFAVPFLGGVFEDLVGAGLLFIAFAAGFAGMYPLASRRLIAESGTAKFSNVIAGLPLNDRKIRLQGLRCVLAEVAMGERSEFFGILKVTDLDHICIGCFADGFEADNAVREIAKVVGISSEVAFIKVDGTELPRLAPFRNRLDLFD